MSAEPLRHLSGNYLAAQTIEPSRRSPELQDDLVVSARVLDEVLAADIIVIATPMYNFTIPSQLKVWIDRIVVPRRTFRYSEAGPEGLLGAKRLIIVSARGGFYGKGTPTAALDHQEAYLRSLFGFLGFQNIELVRAEWVQVSREQRINAIESAQRQIAEFQTS